MQNEVFIYKPTEEELKAIEASWFEDFQKNYDSLTNWFQDNFSRFVEKELNKKMKAH